MIILKVTKNQGFTLYLEDTIFEKPQGGGCQIDPPSVALGLNKERYRLKKITKNTRTQLCRNVVFNKVEGWRYNINIKSLLLLHFFFAPLITKSKLSAIFVGSNSLFTCNIILPISYNVKSCEDILRNELKIKQDKDLCSKTTRYMDIIPPFWVGVDSFLY